MYRNALVIYHHIRVLKVSVIPWFVCVYVPGVQTFRILAFPIYRSRVFLL
jgi:hypothetical protein